MSWISLLVSIILLGVAILAMSVRIILKKDGRFSHRCAMKDIDMGNGVSYHCDTCTLPPGGRHEDCPRYEQHHGTAATQTMAAINSIEHEER